MEPVFLFPGDNGHYLGAQGAGNVTFRAGGVWECLGVTEDR